MSWNMSANDLRPEGWYPESVLFSRPSCAGGHVYTEFAEPPLELTSVFDCFWQIQWMLPGGASLEMVLVPNCAANLVFDAFPEAFAHLARPPRLVGVRTMPFPIRLFGG